MSGWFYLGGKGEDRSKEDDKQETSNLLLYRNEEIYNKGFEIWTENLHQHNPQQKNMDQNGSMTALFGVGHNHRSFSNDSTRSQFIATGQSCRVFGVTSGGGGMNCQDCGNQAKKDCAHLRCRTCCKSRGFQCQTHVKSTWVSAAKRREKLQHQEQFSDQQEEQQQHRVQNNLKRVRESHHGLKAGRFPSEVSTQAVFRGVRVSTVDESVEQYAYQAIVNIGGHVFKGMLYDQGPDVRCGRGETRTCDANTSPVTANTSAPLACTNLLDPSSLIPATAPMNAFMAGTQFFPTASSLNLKESCLF